jgi:hypothetical protein
MGKEKTWIPIGFKKAVQKTSQALRERTVVDCHTGGGQDDREDDQEEDVALDLASTSQRTWDDK